MDIIPKILKPEELAEHLGCSVRWIYAHGLALGGVKIGRRWIFTEEGFMDAMVRLQEEQVAKAKALQRTAEAIRLENRKRRLGPGARNKKKLPPGRSYGPDDDPFDLETDM